MISQTDNTPFDPTADGFTPVVATGNHDWPPPNPEADLEWWVIRTRSRQEKAVATALKSLGLTHFLPLVSTERQWGKRKAKIDAPLFPGYLFLQGSRDDTFAADRTRRIASTLKVEDQLGLHAELVCLREAIGRGADFDPYPYLKHGYYAEVKSGPYKGLRGCIDRKSQQGQLIIQVNVLQSAMALNLGGALLTPLGEFPEKESL
ncbi:Transcription antitermination protein RfaH [Roseimaritima multifibrata]|uniref:Transcription antitermination protein RfaH n=1 Tax=Roseimaritima multifibrata TaxID=1930274 RepID=A0A517MMF6_9BACT|nr:transcription termination/antitermination NusG family protein [Roseimaritima multifibrata]QDS96068.1 Transcription antitermination protein RfaH [Roseimaritima multifibrata]